MKMKKLVAGLLSAAMVFTSVSYNGYGVNEVEAATTAETTNSDDVAMFKQAVEIDKKILSANAKAKSEQHPAENNDGPATYAFNGEDGNWWHSQWKPSTEEGKVKEGNPIWIQTGFKTDSGNVAKKVCKITFTARTGANNVINEYEVQIANQPTKDKNQVTDSDFRTVKHGFLKKVETEQSIYFQPVEATHIRLVAKSVYDAPDSGKHVCAKHIRVFEEGTGAAERTFNLNSYLDFWKYESLVGKLGEQDATDRWNVEVKPTNGTWKNRKANEDNMKFFENGNSGSVDTENQGEWVRNVGNDWTDKVWFNGFRNITTNYASSAISWNAPRAGYYKFEQVGNAGSSGLNGTDKKMELCVVKANEKAKDGTSVHTLNNGNAFVTKAQKLAQNDKFRLMTVCTSGSFDYFGTLNDSNTFTWKVTDCTKETVKAYATEARKQIDASGKSETAKATANAKLGELNNLLTSSSATNDQLIEAEDAVKNAITELEALVEKFTVTVENATATATEVESGATVTVTANQPLAGQKFSHWTVNGETVQGTETTKEFTITADTTIKAVYVVEFPLTCKVQYDEAKKIASFIAARQVPAGVTVLKHGIIMTDETGYNAYQDKFSMGSKRKIVRTAKSTTNVGRYGIRLSKVTGTWYARGYVEYRLSDGTTGYYYSPITQVTFK